MRDESKTVPMRDFILSSGNNLQTATLVYQSFDLVVQQLVVELVAKVKKALTAETDWVVVVDTLASDPFGQYAHLLWAPKEWAELGWGLSSRPRVTIAVV